MARYKRKKKDDIPEAIFSILIALAILASFSVPFREVMFFFLKIIVFIAIIAGVVAVIYKIKKANDAGRPGYDLNPSPKSWRPVTTGTTNAVEKELDHSSLPTSCASSAEWSLGSIKKTGSVEWSMDLLRELEWKRFETICTEYLKSIGYDAKETRIGPDGGVDIIVNKEGQEKPLAIVQCKAWNKYNVGVKPIRELFGLMAAERVINGMFITTGDYSAEAREFAKGKNLRLITGERLLEVIKQLPVERKERLLSLAREGDYTTPTCPRCGTKMTIRESSKGRNAGNKFWGCLYYPRCRSTLVYKQKQRDIS